MNKKKDKCKEKGLKYDKNLYRTLFESSVAGVYIADLNGNIIECNDS